MIIRQMMAQEIISQTKKYLEYVENHIENVRLSYHEFISKCGQLDIVKEEEFQYILRMDVINHDVSKLSKEEFTQYRDKFYPSYYGVDCKSHIEFNKAWENHKNENTHHHETAGTLVDIAHMVIDWMAMGKKFNDTPRQFYESNKESISLSDEHLEFLHKIFDALES